MCCIHVIRTVCVQAAYISLIPYHEQLKNEIFICPGPKQLAITFFSPFAVKKC